MTPVPILLVWMSAAVVSVAFLLGGCAPAESPAAGLVLDVRRLGAAGDGKTNDTPVIQKAIDQCVAAGGGTVTLPPGTYLCGALRLGSKLTFQIQRDATLLASTRPEDFPPIDSRWEGIERQCHSCLINAADAQQITLTGEGVIDGSGEPWWQAFRARSSTLKFPRPRLVELIRCRQVRITDLHLKNSPAWTLHLLYCEDVEVANLTITAPSRSPNTDGIDVDSSRNVKISRCTIDCGDDCIAIKSGRDAEGRRVNRPSEDIAVSDCTMYHGNAGVACGSEMSGGIRRLSVSACRFEGTGIGIRLKSVRGRGGVVEDIRYDHIYMKDVGLAISLTLFYELKPDLRPRKKDEGTPAFRDVWLTRIVVDGAKTAGGIYGLGEMPITNLVLRNITVTADTGLTLWNVRDLDASDIAIKAKTGPATTLENVTGPGAASLKP